MARDLKKDFLYGLLIGAIIVLAYFILRKNIPWLDALVK
jgi:tetrahydromethanopterin S-methyltransferase subunit G